MPESERTSITALAQRVGVSRKRVTSAIERGDIPASCLAETTHGRIIIDAAEAERALRAALADKPARIAVASPALPDPLDFEDPETWPRDLEGLRVVREWWVARHAKRKDDLAADELVRTEDVKREAFVIARTLRDGLLRIPDRIAEGLAATLGADSHEVHRQILSEIEQQLSDVQTALRRVGRTGGSA